MTRLSVNINKVALLRNARGMDLPNVVQVALDCERFGADGITVHPRPDERHTRYQDCHDLKPVLTKEFNIEGQPERKWMDLVTALKPHQATLVPDPPNVLTSHTGWDTIANADFLKDIVAELQAHGIRVSIFVNPIEQFVEGAAAVGADRIELYTGPYAQRYADSPEQAVAPYIGCARFAHSIGLGVNAGHDLNLDNLRWFHRQMPYLDEVSIGHALISDALYFGLENTIQLYQRCLGK